MENNVSAATATLGLDGSFCSQCRRRQESSEQAIETTAVEDFCRDCGVQARLHKACVPMDALFPALTFSQVSPSAGA